MADIILGVDTGETFTDGFFTDGKRIEKVKVDTTPHDLTVCFINCLEEGAKAFGFDSLRSFLKQVKVARFSSTTSTNIFVQRTGTPIGIILTKGFEDSLYDKSGKTQMPSFIFNRELTEGLDDQVMESGEMTRMTDDINLMAAMKRLLDRGARTIVISLHNAHLNRQIEKRIKQIIDSYYPRHYLGSLPIIAASELCNHPDEAGRTNLALMDAYVHPKVADTLYRAEDRIRDSGYRQPLLIVDSSGGCSRVAKTAAYELMGSTLVAGCTGSQFWASKYGLSNVTSIDIGGTSFDVGLIVNGEVLYAQERRLFDIPVAIPVFEVSSIGLGGGSIAKVDLVTKTVGVGPESAGALPGPACYDLGGEDPTTTDANVVLGRIDPNYFLGGRRKLNADAARDALQKLAGPLGTTVEEMALRIADKVAETGATYIRSLWDRAGKSAKDFVLFSYGGAGATHCCEMAEKLGISKIYSFPFSSTFGAFGTSIMDVSHVYMQHRVIPLVREGKVVIDVDAFNNVVKEEQTKAIRDMTGEGFKKEDIKWTVELEINDDKGHRILVNSTKVLLENAADGQSILEAYKAKRASMGGLDKVGQNVQIDVFYIKSRCSLATYEFHKHTPGDSNPEHALKEERHVLGKDWPAKTKVYNRELLKCGNVVTGPAIIEGNDTTFVIPKAWKFSIDEYLNGIIHKVR